MLILGPILDLDGPNPESWYRCAKTQTVEVHFLQGNQSTPCLRLEQSEHTAGTPLPSLSGRGESQPLHPHWDGAEEEQAPFLPLIPYPAQTSQDNLPQLQRDPLFGQSLPAGLSNQHCSPHSMDSWPWPPLTIHRSAGSAGSPSSPPSSSSSGTGRLDPSILAAGSCLQIDDLQARALCPRPTYH